MSEALGRVRMETTEMVGGHGTRTEEMIPIVVDGAIPRDVVCWVPSAVHSERKERAIAIINALNVPSVPPAAAAVAHEDQLAASTLRTRATTLEVGVRMAIDKLHEILNGQSLLDPLKSLSTLEACLAEAGIAPPPRPGLGFPMQNFVAANAPQQWPNGHAPIPASYANDGDSSMEAGGVPVDAPRMIEVGGVKMRERRFHDVGVEYRRPEDVGGDELRQRSGDAPKVITEVGSLLHDYGRGAPDEERAERREHTPGLGVEYREGYDAKTAKGQGYPVRASDVPEFLRRTEAGDAGNIDAGYKPRNDAAADVTGLSEHIKIDGTEKPAS